MRNRKLSVMLAAAMLLTALPGCGDKKGSSADESSSAVITMNSELHVSADENVDPECSECIRTYFLSLENCDYDAYKAALYPPYREHYENWLKQNDLTPEKDFDKMCRRFDEDGYESWHLTELALTYYQDEASTIPDFLNSFVTGNIVPEDFPDQLNTDCSEIHDVVFSLQALYSGDTEPTTVVQRQGILAVKNADGWYLLG